MDDAAKGSGIRPRDEAGGAGIRPWLDGLGIDQEGCDYGVALAGNPNTGKSTLFNALTGLKQHTGNWPGKTVTRAEGLHVHRGMRYRIVDLPGTYSLLSASVDEEIARDFILFGRPHGTIVVVDATALERNLNLVMQVLEITDRVVVCLNLMDEAERKGITIDHVGLAGDLGVPVVPTVARYGRGLGELMTTLTDVIEGRMTARPRRLPVTGEVQGALDELVPMLEELHPGLPNARWIALRLLDGDYAVRQALLSGELARLVTAGGGICA